MAPEFTVGHWGTVLEVPDFMAWRGATDQRSGYEFHRYFVQALQAEQQAQRWVFKSPVHLGNFSHIFAVYPDARVIHTHRDPVKVIPSTVSTTTTTRWLRTDHVDQQLLAQSIAFGFEFMLKQKN